MRRAGNRLALMVGSYLAVNGSLLLFSPARFARFHKMPSLPDPVNEALDGLAAHRRASRAFGLTGVLVGLTCLVVAVARTSPHPAMLDDPMRNTRPPLGLLLVIPLVAEILLRRLARLAARPV